MGELENAYRMLDLEPGASLDEVNQAYKDLVFIWHPDRLPKENQRLVAKAQEKLKQLNHARDYLRTHARISRLAYGSGGSGRTGTSTGAPPRERTGGSATGSAHSAAPGRSPDGRYYRGHYGPTPASPGGFQGGTGSAQTRSHQAGAKASSSGDHGPRAWQTPRSPGATYGSGHGVGNGSNGANGANNYSPGKGGDGATRSPGASPNSPNPYYRDTWNSGYPSGGFNHGFRPGFSTGFGQGFSTHRSNAANPHTPPPPYSRPDPQPPNPARSRPMDPDLSGSDLQGADLQEKDLAGRNLSNANLSGANLKDAFLHKVNLNRANLSKANLFRANLLQANLSHANLREANLIGADLSGADLSGADLSGAQVKVGDRMMVKLTGTNLRGAILPDGTIHA